MEGSSPTSGRLQTYAMFSSSSSSQSREGRNDRTRNNLRPYGHGHDQPCRQHKWRTLNYIGSWILPLLATLSLSITYLFLSSSISYSINDTLSFSSSLSEYKQFNTSMTSQKKKIVSHTNVGDYADQSTVHGSRMAICLVGGARRFGLTGPTIIKNILLEYPEADLFLHSPLDSDSFKLSILHVAPRIASIKIFTPKHIEETEPISHVLSLASPKGRQGLLQYFNLVEGCLTLINAHETRANITYDWIVRTRVDGYWTAPLDQASFVPGTYIVPSGSHWGGLNDRLGVGDKNTSIPALSRLSLIPQLDAAKLRRLNSEAAFKAQLDTSNVSYGTRPFPFCVLSDRTYTYPPRRGVPVASMGSLGPLSGAKCRPCTAACVGDCVVQLGQMWQKNYTWTEWRNGRLELCDPTGPWEEGWENIFDEVAGREAAMIRKRVKAMDPEECLDNFDRMRRKTVNWASPSPWEICHHSLIAATNQTVQKLL